MTNERFRRLLEIQRYTSLDDHCWDSPTEIKLRRMGCELIEMIHDLQDRICEMADPRNEERKPPMPQPIMSASQAKSACEGAGAPPELMTAAEAKGLDLNSLFQAYQQITVILADTTKTGAQKTWAILTVVITTLFTPGSAPP